MSVHCGLTAKKNCQEVDLRAYKKLSSLLATSFSVFATNRRRNKLELTIASSLVSGRAARRARTS
jgi:hypothetical protein